MAAASAAAFRKEMTMTTIWDDCIRLRKSLHKTQADVAAELGITQSAVAQFERHEMRSFKILTWYIHHGLYSADWYEGSYGFDRKETKR